MPLPLSAVQDVGFVAGASAPRDGAAATAADPHVKKLRAKANAVRPRNVWFS